MQNLVLITSPMGSFKWGSPSPRVRKKYLNSISHLLQGPSGELYHVLKSRASRVERNLDIKNKGNGPQNCTYVSTLLFRYQAKTLHKASTKDVSCLVGCCFVLAACCSRRTKLLIRAHSIWHKITFSFCTFQL